MNVAPTTTKAIPPQVRGVRGGVVDLDERAVVDPDGDDGREEEHPLHGDRHGRVADDDVAESREVGGVADGADDAREHRP